MAPVYNRLRKLVIFAFIPHLLSLVLLGSISIGAGESGQQGSVVSNHRVGR